MIKSKQFNSKKVWSSNKKSLSSGSRSKVFFNENTKQISNQKPVSASNKIFGPERIIISKPNLFNKVQDYFGEWKKTKHDFAWFRTINGWFVNFEGIKQFNRNTLKTFCIVLAIFLCYLTFFDTFFLIKDYNINFGENSYLSSNQTTQLIESLQKNKAVGIFPNNQYWFLNSQTMTASAKDVLPEIQSITINNKSWPDKVDLTIDTKPILVTLSVKENNEQKYWRIGQDGNVVGEDQAGIWQNLVVVEKPYNVAFQNKNNQDSATLKNFTFRDNKVQLKKFQLIQKIWPALTESGIKIVSTSVPSLVDSDIFLVTENGTKLMFDSQVFDQDNQTRRATEFLRKLETDGTRIIDLERQGKLKYIDFRIAKRLYYCYNNDKC